MCEARPFDVDGEPVSSTRIREAIQGGDLDTANRLLGRWPSALGEVVHGDGRGVDLGFPTANLSPENEILPAAGVYAGHVRLLDEGTPIAGTRLPVVTNVGHRPTFLEGGGVVAEAHVIDWEGNLYGRRVEISFVGRLRGERKFSGVDALKEQIRIDVEEARRRLEAL